MLEQLLLLFSVSTHIHLATFQRTPYLCTITYTIFFFLILAVTLTSHSIILNMYSLYNTTEPAPKGHFSHDIHCYFKFILALVDSLINNNNLTSLFTFKSKITMFWSRNPLDLTVDWETNDRLFSCRRKHWTPCSVCLPPPLTHLRQLPVYLCGQPDVFFFSLFIFYRTMTTTMHKI